MNATATATTATATTTTATTVNPGRLDANRELARRFFAEQDRLRGGPADALCAPGYRATLGGGPTMDRAGHEQVAKAFYAAMPDLAHTVEIVAADGDTVAVRFVLRGTNTGGFFGLPASGRKLTIAAHVVLRVQEGRVEELFGIFDEAGMLRQMGVLPSG